ncbi:GPTC4-like protein [Mya arenaria]|uniref:G patch domain-containing protein 4 n=1 Tax=Mya arenaria TaxID=6604 RepID=A0ABY7E6Q8_MYAAR|nr:GPTC4-like protein [Mya arenaria]
MDFAEKQLQKHGWKSGEGLGRERSGITEAIKVKIKNDNKGDGIQIENAKATKVTKSKAKSYADKSMLYGQFIKGATLSDGRESKDSGHVSDSSEDEADKHTPCLVPDTEAEVFRRCGGRTAHKGARHGLKLNGKLARIEEQERQELKQIKQTEKQEEKTRNTSSGITEVSTGENGEAVKTKNKKKKKRKEKVENDEGVNVDVEKLNDNVGNAENGGRIMLKAKKCEGESEAESNTTEDVVAEVSEKKDRKSKKQKRKIEETKEVSNVDNSENVICEESTSRKKKKKSKSKDNDCDMINDSVSDDIVTKSKKKKSKRERTN